MLKNTVSVLQHCVLL